MSTRDWRRLGSALLLGAIALSGCGTLCPPSVANQSDAAGVDSDAVQSLQRQMKERDKRIEELESQLEVLKLIDQDMDERKKPIRAPATLTPAE